jgi:hypothetical protein
MSKYPKIDKASGRMIEDAELVRLNQGVAVPAVLAELLRSVPLIGVRFSLTEDDDQSGIGVELRWMTPDQILSEATEAYPGLVAVKRGYFPIGICLEGSGDPYFLRQADGAVVRIPHDAASETDLDEDAIEVVVESVDRLITLAEVE